MKLLLIVFLAIGLQANINVVCKAGIMEDSVAKNYINELLKREPNNIECIIKLANVHLKNGELLKGYNFLAKAYKINPDGVKYSDISDIVPFALEITELVESAKKSGNKELWNKIGDNFFEMGVYMESITAYTNSLLLDQKQSNIALKLAQSYEKSNQPQKAVEQLEVLLAQNAKNFYANYYLGKILRYIKNDEENAKNHLQKAKKILLATKEKFPKTQYPSFMLDINRELDK